MADSANRMLTSARIGEIDALRALAMLSVIALHAGLFPVGWAGVWLFYVVSGYVVTLSVVVQHPDGAGLARFGAFLSRRLVRIVPVYYLFLLAGLAVAALRQFPQEPLSIAGLFLFFNNWTAITLHDNINGWPSGHLWTLSVEMQFYLLYGLALCLLPRRRTIELLIALLLLCPAARFVAGIVLAKEGWAPADAAYWVYAAPGLHFDSFAMGALLAFAGRGEALGRIARPLALAGVGLLVCYCAAYLWVNHLWRAERGLDAGRNILSGILFGQHREALAYSALATAMAGLVALAASRDPVVMPLLGQPILQWMGGISYAGYLVQPLGRMAGDALLGLVGIDGAQGPYWARLALFVVATGFTLLLAQLSWRLVETPLRRRLGGRTLLSWPGSRASRGTVPR